MRKPFILLAVILAAVALMISCDKTNIIRYETSGSCTLNFTSGAQQVNWPPQFDAHITITSVQRGEIEPIERDLTIKQDAVNTTLYRATEVVEVPVEVYLNIAVTAFIGSETWEGSDTLYLSEDSVRTKEITLDQVLPSGVLYSNDFTSSDLSDWTFEGDTVNVAYSVQYEELHLTQTITGDGGILKYDTLFPGYYMLEYDIRVINPIDIFYRGGGAICFHDFYSDNGYIFTLEFDDIDNWIWLWRGYYDVVDTAYVSIATGVDYHIKLENEYGNIKGYLNDVLVIDYVDTLHFSGGMIGFRVQGCEIAVDNVVVTEVSGPGPSPNNPPYEPYDPIPADGETDVDTASVTLGWTGDDPDGDIVTYLVRWGTSTAFDDSADTGTMDRHSIFDLQPGTFYFWQVTAEDEHGESTDGPVWEFYTKSSVLNNPPFEPFDPIPADGEADVDTASVTLGWTGGDPDGDIVTYLVRWGTSTAFDDSAETDTSDRHTIFDLQSGAQYYWQVIAEDQPGTSTPGQIWEFTTESVTGGLYTIVGSYDTPGFAWDVIVAGGYAYVAEDALGLSVINVSDPANPTEVGFCDTPGQAYSVAVAGNYAYVADGTPGLQIIRIQ